MWTVSSSSEDWSPDAITVDENPDIIVRKISDFPLFAINHMNTRYTQDFVVKM